MGGRHAVAGLLLAMIAISLAGCSIVDQLLPRRPVMSREQAIAAGKAAEPDFADEQVMAARLGTWKELAEPGAPIEGPQPDPADPVWTVNLGWLLGPLDGQGVILILDGRDGHVIQRRHWIS